MAVKPSSAKNKFLRKDTFTAVFIAVQLFTRAKGGANLNAYQQIWHMHTTGYDAAIKENEMMPFVATRMTLECVTLSEVSQKDAYM